MKTCKNKFLKRLVVIVTVVYLIMNCIAPNSVVYANQSQARSGIDWKGFFSQALGAAAAGIVTGVTIGATVASGGTALPIAASVISGIVRGGITYKAVGMISSATLEGDSIADIPGNLLKELLELIVYLGDVVIGMLQSFMLGDEGFMGRVMISNKDDNLGIGSEGKEDSGSWLYANEEDVENLKNGTPSRGAAAIIAATSSGMDDNLYVDRDYKVPNILYSPENIFSNKIAALDANYINPHSYNSIIEGGEESKSLATQIAPTVATWYRALRNLAIVGLLSVLVYIGIRILIGTVSEKAKYKERLFDWFVALCMVFFMHFIMAGIMMLSEKIMDLVGSAGNFGIIVNVDDGAIFKTTFIGLIRFCAQSNSWSRTAAFSIMYLLLVGITVRYTFIYLKRALYLAFFTIIAPMVALTYPLDKIKDSQAQAFDMWIKEYFINAIIQPVHLLLYTVFVGSSMSLAIVNPIYGVVVLLFLPTAEKWIKKMFKIDKAPLTATSLGDMALLGTMFGMGKNIVGGVTKGVTTLGTAVATGGPKALGSGIYNSYVAAPIRYAVTGGKMIHDKVSKPKGEGVEEMPKELPEPNQNDLQHYNDMKAAGYSKEELAQLADDLDLTEYLKQKEKMEGKKQVKGLKIGTNDEKATPESVGVGQNLEDMSGVPQQENEETTRTKKDTRSRLVSPNQSLNGSGDEAQKSQTSDKETKENDTVTTKTPQSEYEKAMLQDRKRDKLYKRDEADEVKNLINQTMVGAGGALVGAAVGTIMTGVMGDPKMAGVGTMAGATAATTVRDVGTSIKDAPTKNNIKILVNEGITNNNIIRNAAQIASKDNWSEDKMKMIAKMADMYPDLAKNKESLKALTEDLKKAGLTDEKMREKAIKDIKRVQTNVEQVEKKEKDQKDKNIQRWK